jgi:hypothetical protein
MQFETKLSLYRKANSYLSWYALCVYLDIVSLSVAIFLPLDKHVKVYNSNQETNEIPLIKSHVHVVVNK